jgi:hypothetical protein
VRTAESCHSRKSCSRPRLPFAAPVEPADYKRYVLPIIFLRFLSLLRYDCRPAELDTLGADKDSDYYGDKGAIQDPDEYRRRARPPHGAPTPVLHQLTRDLPTIGRFVERLISRGRVRCC